MPKWVVTTSEWSPCYERHFHAKVDGEWAREIELSVLDAAFITRAYADFEHAHEILHAAYQAAQPDGSVEEAT